MIKSVASRALDLVYRGRIERAKRKMRGLRGVDPEVRIHLECLGIRVNSIRPTLVVNPEDEGISAELYAWGIREPLNTYHLYHAIRGEVDRIDAVLDIGSNIGYFPLIEIAAGAKRVVAVEPVPETYRYLKRNLGGYDGIQLINAAVSDRDQPLNLYIPEKLNLATALPSQEYLRLSDVSVKRVIQIRAMSLESLIESQGLRGKKVLIRMDVEGYERRILERVPEEVYGISLELHSAIMGADSAVSFVGGLRSKGFEVEVVTRELNKLIPLIRIIGLRRAVRLYESAVEKRVFLSPSWDEVEAVIRAGRENPHLLLFRR